MTRVAKYNSKLLFFKVSSCSVCKRQEELLKLYNIPYIPCELFKNRELARKYAVTDVPSLVIVDSQNNFITKYDFLLNRKYAEEILNILQKNQ